MGSSCALGRSKNSCSGNMVPDPRPDVGHAAHSSAPAWAGSSLHLAEWRFLIWPRVACSDIMHRPWEA